MTASTRIVRCLRFLRSSARVALAGVLGGASLLALSACTTNPATGKQSLTFLSWEQEAQMGAEAAPQFTAEFGGAVESARANAYIERVGRELLKGIESGVPGNLEWEFTLLDSDVINAFALPGGKVFMSRGLAEKLNSEAQLAGVLGHEIGHVTARHGNQRISKQIGFNAIMTGLAVGVGVADEDSSVRKYGQYAVPALAVGGNVVLLKYGRDEESEADMLGVRYMTRAGYNPMGQVQVMEVLKAASGGGSAGPEWLSTHPAPQTRIDRLKKIIREEYAFTQNNEEYGDFRARYEREFLRTLGSLDPARPGPHENVPSLLASFDGSAGGSWCALCNGEVGR